MPHGIDFVAMLALGLVRQNSLRDCVAALRQPPQVGHGRWPVLRQASSSPSAALLTAPEIAPDPHRLPRPAW